MRFAFWIVLSIIVQTVLSIRPMPNDIRKVYKARMNKKTFKVVKNLHMNWYVHAIKALFGQIGKELYQQLSEGERKLLASCLDQIVDERDLAAGAKCLVQARFDARAGSNRQKIGKSTQPDVDDDSSAFIIANDSGEEIGTEKRKLGNEDSDGFQKTNSLITYSSSSGSRNMSFEQYPAETPMHHARPGDLRDSVLHKFQPSTLSNNSRTANVSYGRTSRIFRYLELPPNDRKSLRRLHVKRIQQLTKEGKGFENSYVTGNEIATMMKTTQQASTSEPDEKTGIVESEEEFSEQFDSNNNILHRKNSRSSRKNSKKLNSVPASLFAYTYKVFHLNSIRSDAKKFWKERRWQTRRKRSPYRLIASHVMKSDNIIVDVINKDRIQSLHDPVVKKTPIQQMSKFINVLLRGKEAGGNWTRTYQRIIEFKEKMDQRSRSRGARVYDLRLLDLVLGNEYPSRSKVQSSYKDFISMAFDFVNKLGRNRKKDLNFRFLSPRLMPVMPDKIQARERVLSPSIMSFYKDDSPDSIASLPKLLENSGLTEKDRQAVLEMVMDVSGARAAVDMSLDVLKETNILGLDDQFFESTKRIGDIFTKLEASFNKQQSDDMDNKGYTFLEVPQIEEVLRNHGVKKPKDVDFDVEIYGKLNRSRREEALWANVERIARSGTEERNRTKREAIAVLAPVVLAPFMFSPTFGASILGPVVLSPNIFSPLILNPSVLGPFVLNPSVFMPFIISPYILSPYVMTPIVGAPFILNPYILSPNVINPYILSPLILSPYILCPDVVSPQALGGQILSPSVFSPSIFTESVLMASVLSPSWMSK